MKTGLRASRFAKASAIAAIAFAGAFALALVGCGGSSSQSAAPKDTSCYVMTHTEAYASGEVLQEQSLTLDERGGVIGIEGKAYGMEPFTITQECLLDENGRVTSVTTDQDGAVSSVTYEYQGEPYDGLFDSFAMAGDGENSMTTTYEYMWYDANSVKSVVATNDLMIQEQTYSEDGYRASSKTTPQGNSGFIPRSTEYVYEVDADGNVTSITASGEMDGQQFTETYTCECDENGNITKVIAADGSTVATYEWVKIDNPYAYVRATSKASVGANF